MAKLVYATDLKSVGRKAVRVRVPLPVHLQDKTFIKGISTTENTALNDTNHNKINQRNPMSMFVNQG